jgi:hypothetical protein
MPYGPARARERGARVVAPTNGIDRFKDKLYRMIYVRKQLAGYICLFSQYVR